MAAHKLDIEFEDDDEVTAQTNVKKKQQTSVHEVDIDFSVSEETNPGIEAPKLEEKAPAPAPAAAKGTLSIQEGQYQDVGAVPAQSAKEYELGDEFKRVSATNKLLTAEVAARVEIETQKKIVSTVAQQAQDAKVLEMKVNKLLSQAIAKAPAAKQELMMIKKLISEHAKVGPKKASSGTAKRKVVKKAA